MARVSPTIITKIRRHCLLLAGLSMFFVTGCSQQQAMTADFRDDRG